MWLKFWNPAVYPPLHPWPGPADLLVIGGLTYFDYILSEAFNFLFYYILLANENVRFCLIINRHFFKEKMLRGILNILLFIY